MKNMFLTNVERLEYEAINRSCFTTYNINTWTLSTQHSLFFDKAIKQSTRWINKQHKTVNIY